MKFIKKKPAILILSLILSIGLVFSILFFAIPRYKKLNDFEQLSFNEKSEKLVNFFEEIDDGEEGDIELKIISYIMEMHYAETNSQDMTLEELQNAVDQSFTNVPSIKDYLQSNMNPSIPNKHIYYNDIDEIFSIEKDLITHKEAISTPISKYMQTSVKKKGNLFKATYAKYNFDNPYDIIDHTSQFDVQSTHSIKDYLSGEGTNLALKELLTNESVQGIGDPEKEITIIFELKDNQLKISEYTL